MSKREPRLLIQDILESIEKIRLYTKNYDFGAFESDNKTIDAVIRNLEIIGEAANKLPQEVKKKNKDIKW